MQPLARTWRYLTRRYLQDWSSQNTARANAAEAHGILRERRREKDEIDATLRALLRAYRGADGARPRQGGGDVEHAG